MSEFYQMPGSLEGRRPKVSVTKSCMVEIVAHGKITWKEIITR